MDLKAEFITRLCSGERMTDLCREYGIARKTGHKLKRRYEELGAHGLIEGSRAPLHVPHKTPPEIIELILAERKLHATWGPKKLKDVLEKRLGRAFPASSTIGDLLVARGMVTPRKTRPRHTPAPTGLRTARGPNDIWCADYKGQFRLGDRSYCYPLTATDHFSRYILGCEGMGAISDDEAQAVFDGIFKEHGLPEVIRSDNGVPFASTGLAGLTKLSVFWLRLGIVLERIRPAHPQENGRHERMHRTLKRETTRPPRANLLQQQEAFDAFVEEFNTSRPHEALGMKRPAEVYQRSTRPCPQKLPELKYPMHDDVILVSRKGFIQVAGRGKIYLAGALAGQEVGIREEDDGRWLVTFADLDLGWVEAAGTTFTPAPSSPPEGR